MGRIRLIAARQTAVFDQVAERLDQHFARGLVIRSGGDAAALAHDDAVVVFIQRAADGDAAPWSELADPRLEAALAAGVPLIPVLIDGAAMPTERQLPPSVRGLAFQHALPLRGDGRLPRDVGRLIVDLEAQLRHVVGNLFAYDLWLMPLGVLAALFGFAYSVVYARDLTDWSFGYETVERFRHGMRVLLLAGPGALGAGLLMIAAGVWWRRTRKAARLRAEYFRLAAGELPELDNALAFGCLAAGAAAVGWGFIAGAIAFTLGVCALLTTGERPLRRAGAAAVFVGLAAAIAGSVWTTVTGQVERRLAAAIAQYEAGRQELDAGRLAEARLRFQSAADLHPPYANAHLRLAELAVREQKLDAALEAADRAIARYPTQSQSSFGPDQQIVSDAYGVRAEIYSQLGDAPLAAADRDMMSKVSGFINIFGGMFRFWESPPTAPAE